MKTGFLIEIRQRPILAVGVPTTTFGASKLNFCVRNGNRWVLTAIITGMAPLVGLEATRKIKKSPILGKNKAKSA